MLFSVGLQVVAVSVLALVTLLFFGALPAYSLFFGGLAAIIPNALFALRLWLHRGRRPESYPAVFFIGEFAKIGLTAALLWVLVVHGGPIHGFALMIGLIAALKMPLFALWFVRDSHGQVEAEIQRAGQARSRPNGEGSVGRNVDGA